MSAVGSDQRRHVIQGIGSSAGGTWYLPRWASWYLESVCRRYHGHLNGSCNDNIELYFVDYVPVSSMKCGRLLARPKDRPLLPSGYFLDPVSVAHQHISHTSCFLIRLVGVGFKAFGLEIHQGFRISVARLVILLTVPPSLRIPDRFNLSAHRSKARTVPHTPSSSSQSHLPSYQ